MIHLYYGDGKGKTTAACGLAIRGAGSGMKVLFAQFFKSGNSSEVAVLSSVPSITVRYPELCYGRYKMMTGQQKADIEKCYSGFIKEVEASAQEYDMIVLDEAVSAYGYGLFSQADIIGFLKREGEKREIVLTGRDPAGELIEMANYATEMRKTKHPFDGGLIARKGIEY